MLKRLLEKLTNGILYFYYRLTLNFEFLGWPVIFGTGVEIENAETIRLGNKSKIGKDTWMRSAVVGTGDGINIGASVDIGRRSFISCAKKINIGDHCLFGTNVTIVDNNHAYEDLTSPISRQGISKPQSISIGSESWIGSNAVILPGTKIGKHCVVAANCVIGGNIPDLCVVAGIPGKIVKYFDNKSGKWVKTNN